jgi:hypothetical protein
MKETNEHCLEKSFLIEIEEQYEINNFISRVWQLKSQEENDFLLINNLYRLIWENLVC